jgi:phosphoserine phosphatase RsbU/P
MGREMSREISSETTRDAKVQAGLRLLCVLVLLISSLASLRAQTPANPSSASTSVAIHGTLDLNGPWRFHTGDDPSWANPDFDDSSWPQISLSSSLAEQGIETYSGYAWYRIRIPAEQLAQAGYKPASQQSESSPLQPVALLITGSGIAQSQAFLNSIESGHTRGMPSSSSSTPSMFTSPPYVVQITETAPDGSILLAIRTWADVAVSRGLLEKVQLASAPEIAEHLELANARRWGQHALSGMVACFLFLCVAGLAATLYLAQRNHSEYLWLSLLCISVALRGAFEVAFSMALIPLNVVGFLGPWSTWLFIVTTLEFVLRFTGNHMKRLVRGWQIAALILPFSTMLHFDQIAKYASLASQLIFCGLVAFMLFRAWRRGSREAGVMLLPFFLAATADSIDIFLDFAANRHWLPDQFLSHRHHMGPVEFSTSTVTYLIFLGSLIAVILYRFIRVSEQEQRSAADLEAARSVQAMLIPTTLPGNRNFVMESAYLPANGVGGDFFQVLPLKDDSMLIVVGDVSGKGLQAAMNASTLVGALRNEIAHEPATILAHLNHVMLGATNAPGVAPVAAFATCLCARIYPSGEMHIANAGHLSPYRDGREMELAACLPLGVIPGVEYEQSTFKLNHGDRLTFISDGVIEAADSRGELFGFERTQQVSHEPARYIAQIAQRFGQTDDITVVSLYFKPA